MYIYYQLSDMFMYISTIIAVYLLTPSYTNARHVSSMYNGLDDHENWDLLPHEACGRGGTLPKVDIKVIGGNNAYLGQFPWMANLFVTFEHQLQNDHDCGGSVINKHYILSAAHCCENVSPERAWIRVGEYNLNNDGEECTAEGCVDPVQNIPVESFTLHENFSSVLHDDICLIRLRHPITFNEYVHPVCLPIYQSLIHRSFAGEDMKIAGWGYSNKYRKTPTPILQTTEVPVVSNQDCREEYSDLEPKEICAGGLVGDNLQQFCMGDSGGPLMKEVEVAGRTKYFVFGIVSYIETTKLPGTNYLTCDVEVPGVFVRVTSYLDWILDHLKP